MKASSKKSRKKASTNTKALTKIRKPICPPGSEVEQVLDPDVPADAVERQRKHARADQDENHEGRQFGGGFDGLANQVPGQPALKRAEDQRAAGPHGAAFGRRGDADEDGAEHQKDQKQRRHHNEGGLLRHVRQEAEAREAGDDPIYDSNTECEHDPEKHAQHHEVSAVRGGITHHEPAEDSARHTSVLRARSALGCRLARGIPQPPPADLAWLSGILP